MSIPLDWWRSTSTSKEAIHSGTKFRVTERGDGLFIVVVSPSFKDGEISFDALGPYTSVDEAEKACARYIQEYLISPSPINREP